VDGGQWDLGGLGRLGLAALGGGLLGIRSRGQPGGLRTHAMVCAGSAPFALTAAHVAGGSGDALVRVLQGVAGGIGFIGAATVLKRGHRIFGVGVASSIWMCGAAGCEFGFGRVGFAMLVVCLATAFNLTVDLLERKYLGFRHEVRAARSVAEEPESP
jgi:putative Mg2+ transporter-C (MgtC) family protein